MFIFIPGSAFSDNNLWNPAFDMKTTTSILLIFVLSLGIIANSSCKKKKDTVPPPPPPALSSDKEITGFIFRQQDNATYMLENINGIIGPDTVYFTLPAGVENTSLKTYISISGKTISPASGTTQNFSTPVTYTVTAENGTTKTYVVICRYRKTVFLSISDGYAYAFDGNNGQQIWKSVSPANKFHSSTPVVTKGLVFLLGMDGMYALDARDGSQKWKFPLINITNFEMLPSPMVVDNTVYFGAWDGYVYSLNALDGSLKWKTPSSSGKRFSCNISISGNTLYAGCDDSSLYSMNIVNGSINWKFFIGWPVNKNPVIINNSVYVGGTNRFYSLNATTGAEQWTYPYHFSWTSHSFYKGRIYLGGGSEAWGLNANTGILEWHVTHDGLVNGYNDRSGAMIVNDTLYGGSINYNVYAYSLITKAKLWTATTFNYVFSSPVVVDNVVYIGGGDGNLYALNTANGTQVWKKVTNGGIYGSACVCDANGVAHYPVISGHKD